MSLLLDPGVPPEGGQSVKTHCPFVQAGLARVVTVTLNTETRIQGPFRCADSLTAGERWQQ